MTSIEELNFNAKVEQYKQVEETKRSLIKSVGIFGINALRGIFLLNSGGAVAILAHTNALSNFKGGAASVKYFAIGALLAVISSGSAYLSEFFSSATYNRTSNAIIEQKVDTSNITKICYFLAFILLIAAIILFCSSCILFVKQLIGLEQLFLSAH